MITEEQLLTAVSNLLQEVDQHITYWEKKEAEGVESIWRFTFAWKQAKDLIEKHLGYTLHPGASTSKKSCYSDT